MPICKLSNECEEQHVQHNFFAFVKSERIEQFYFRTNTPCHQYESFSRMITQKSVSISTVMDASVIIEPYNIWLSKESIGNKLEYSTLASDCALAILCL